MMDAPKPTGKKRYRVEKQLFREPLMVLQIEMRGMVSSYSGGNSVDVDWRNWWIDARPQDVTEFVEP